MDSERSGPAAEPPDAALRRLARLSRAPMIQLRWPWRSFGALAAHWAVTLAALWAGGFPRWRVAAVAGCWAVQAAATLWFAVRGTAPMELGGFPPGVLRLGIVGLLSSTVATALTGALHGPMLVTLLMPSITLLALFGAVRESRVLVAVTAACLALLAAVPGAWAGPALPAAAAGVVAAASLLASIAVVGTNVLRVRGAIRESARELSRVREEMGALALARARGLEEVGAQVAHELKNPLAAVKALAQLGSGDAAAPEGREGFAAVDREVRGMQAVLAQYLSFTRPLEELRPEPVELGPLVDEVLEILAARARRAGIHPRRAGDARVTADRRRLEEALLNLVANAIEATPPGGRVDVEIEVDRRAQGKPDEAARVVVRDTGRGMTAEVLARAGTPFFTTTETGTGLGLALARSVFLQHGGALRLESAPGEGTSVTATLPVEAAARSGPEDAPPARPVAVRLPWMVAALGLALNVVVVGTAVLGGLPRASVAGIAAITLVKLGATIRYAAHDAPPMVRGTYPPRALLLFLVHVFGGAGWMALSGGLQSPFLVTIFPSAVVSLALFDAVWQSRLVLASTVASVLLLPLLPATLTGPLLAGPPGAAAAGVCAIGVLLLSGAHVGRARELLGASGRTLSRAREELASRAVGRARSLEEVGAKVARELERPLADVAALARRGGEDVADPRAREWFGVIGREVARMQGILAEYLTFARPLQSFRPEPVALGPLVADVLVVLSGRAARAGVHGDCRGDASVTADPRRLKEALLNLVSNAIEATPSGGRVDVEVGRDDGQARIVIRDSGRGMTSEVLARLGTPFFTTREAGTGLGVVLARSVFHRHGGGLRYESAPGAGTTVVATLPLHSVAGRAHGERALG